MATVKEMFVEAINEGMKIAKVISDPFNKAQAYAALANAMARTGLIGSGTSQAPAPVEPEGKEALRPAPKTKTEEAPAQPAEVEDSREWTDAMLEKYKVEIDEMNRVFEKFEIDKTTDPDYKTRNQIVGMFSENALNDFREDVTPLNIKAFVEFLHVLERDAENKQAE